MSSKADIRAEADRLRAYFEGQGAEVFEADILQPAGALLNLYGEDIRARAFVTHDPLRGEMMLRPDFTVPLVQRHLASGGGAARYTYAGEVFRRQEDDEDRPVEYIQVGFEMFGGDPADADAETFATIANALADVPVRATIGDFGLIRSAITALDTPDRRKVALLRHIWRPKRFAALLDRYSHPAPPPPSAPSPDMPHVGLRSRAEVEARIAVLTEEAETAPLAADDVAQLRALMSVQAPVPAAIETLRGLGGDRTATEALEKRVAAMARRGVDPETLHFDMRFGLSSLEYYSGFVFGFSGDDLPALATGGRYDLLTREMSGAAALPAVGGVIRPELLLRLKETSS